MKNIRYVILTLTGFQQDPHIGGAKQYHTAGEATDNMAPGDVIIPIENDAELTEYQTGTKRLPTLNRHGRQ